MTDSEWQEVERVFGGALEFPENQRAGYLERACENNPALRAEVESLLAADRRAGSFLDSAEGFRVGLSGQSVGPYKLLEEIGSGGMGTVYRAEREDGKFRQQVAIKIVAAAVASPEIRRRFQAEKQILAALDHPNIARLLDAGVSDAGLPYIAIEYIQGVPVTEYSKSRALSVSSRLQLFRTICSAVHYAHQRLVVHRDLKPGNILVTTDGIPKLLDFGIAKLLGQWPDVAREPTQSLLHPMTPDYASPEQLRGLDVTTASDIYALGVLLYELLTGVRPYRLAGRPLDEAIRVLIEAEPEKPSSSFPQVSHELESIILQAMRKNAVERYASAEEFSNDIGRYLGGRPVLARQPSFFYVTRKFGARHRIGVASSILIALLIVGGVAATVRQARIAEQQRARAQHRFDDVRQLAKSMIFEVHDGVAALPGSTFVRKLIVARSLEYLDSLAQEARDDPALESELAAAYERLGDVQGNPGNRNLGDTEGAVASFRKALAIRESLAARDPGSFEKQRARSADAVRIAESLVELGRIQEALQVHRSELAAAEKYAAGSQPEAKDWLAGAYYGLGWGLFNTGNLDDAVRSFRKSAEIREAIPEQPMPGGVEIKTKLAGCFGALSEVLSAGGKFGEAIESQRKAVTVMETLAAKNPDNISVKHFQGESHFYLGTYLQAAGNMADALQAYRLARDIFESISQADPKDVFSKHFIGFSYERIGAVLVGQGQTMRGLDYLRKAIALFGSLPPEESKNMLVLSGFADTFEGLGTAYEAQGRWREALSYYERSLEIWGGMRRQQGVLYPVDGGKPARLNAAIERCKNHVVASRSGL